MVPFVDFFAASMSFCCTYLQHHWGNFETNIIRVPGVSIAFYFAAVSRLLHLFKKVKNSRHDFTCLYFIGQFFIFFLQDPYIRCRSPYYFSNNIFEFIINMCWLLNTWLYELSCLTILDMCI